MHARHAKRAPIAVALLFCAPLGACRAELSGLADGGVRSDLAQLTEDANPLSGDGRASSPYPNGPYGADVGSVLPNFAFQGYLAPTATTGATTSAPFGAVSLDAFRSTGARVLIVQAACFQCATCPEDAAKISSNLSVWVPKGGLALGVLTQGRNPGPPTQADLDTFVNGAAQSFGTISDSWALNSTSPAPFDQFFTPIIYPYFVIVDLSSMKVVEKITYSPTSSDPVATAISHFAALLN
jgi:hypothetical protein